MIEIDEIMNKLSELIKNELMEKHIRFNANADNSRIILDYLDNRERRIKPKERNVLISQELNHKLENKDFGTSSKSSEEILSEFQHIEQKIRNGENLNFNLSEKIFDSRDKYKDILLNAWKIRHIHLSGNDVSSKSAMKRNRSTVLLFCIEDNDKIMCLDIIEHPSSDKFFCFNLMKIIKNNGWMESIGFFCNDDINYIPGSLRPRIENDEDLTELYTIYKINSAFEFDGKMYCSLDGITVTGDTTHSVRIYQQFLKELRKNTKQNDAFEEITDIVFGDNYLAFSTNIIRGGNKYKYRYQI